MKNPWLIFWRWSNRRGAGFDCSASCLGTTALTILISQKLWSEWQRIPQDQQSFVRLAEEFWPYFLAQFAVFLYEAWLLSRHLKVRMHRSGWWAVLLMLTIIGFVILPPNWGGARLYFLLAFIAFQLPLFVDWTVKAENPE